MTTYPQPDRSTAGANRSLPAVDPVVRNLTEVRGLVRAENVDVDATELGVAAYVTSIDAWGIYGRVPITATVPGGILTVGDADLRYAPLSHDHDAADIVSGVLDVARLGTGTPSAQTYLDGSGAWSEVQQVRLACKNTTASTITAGTPVVATGSVGASGQVEVGPAAANSASTMPAIGCVEEDIAAGDVGHVIALGVIRQIDTQTPGWTINQTLYVGSAGGLTSTRPSAVTDRVQNIARVIRVATSTGEILVLGAGRTNDVPNYAATTLLGRGSASGAGPAQEITIGSGLTLSGTTLSSTGGGGLSDGDYGDVTVSGSGTAITIDNNAVTYAKLQNVSATDRLLGRSSAGAGSVEEITCTAAGRALLDDADAAAQRITLSAGRQVGNRFIELFDDLWSPGGWNSSVAGTNSARTTASMPFAATENAYGLVGLFTGSTATGRASNYDGDEGMFLANGASWMLEMRLCVDVLSDATQEYACYCGFQDGNVTATEPTDGVYFKYVRSVTNTFWVATTANNGTRSSTTTSVAPTANVLQVLRIEVNAAGNSAAFFVDGVSVATITTNIPTTRSTGIGQKIVKSVGTTSRTVYIDYIHLQGTRTTDR